MLFLRSAETNADSRGERVPVAALTAAGLERALLAADRKTRVRELQAALVRDPAVASWTMHAAAHSGRFSPTFDQAIDWLAGCLEAQLSSHLVASDNGTPQSEIDSRLPVLARRLADADLLLERDKLESLKELAYGASHEINNPLANIAARAQTLLVEETNPDRQRKLVAIHRQAMRAHEMIADLMLFARPPKLNRMPCDVRQVVQQVIDELGERFTEQHTSLKWDAPQQPLELSVDSTQLAIAIRALVTNSLEALGEGGSVHVYLQQVERDEAIWVEIAVRDDGPGISDEVREHMFDPFFSGREAGRGLGFGLSKCWRIATDHGGNVVVHRPAAGGTAVAILLPPVMTATT